ncbi:hypothetical protein Dacet_2996 [Denitrovibrio acetiphilus DSM 12809]|uniref:Uncharacterized protein n=1 Tax=Denitrovibrio acetiphilus (strain DSM 12809 / NBRC 114555 / N2460) TaxID=522772 RepID=D4H742_DENA2|nr:hypothetical protein [Denitrovibrio acetiphilus]ADD69746.1 hypothetical protein Dacet_2996 [Denitrovibrio acetiphilus DSM 12809]
MDYTKIETGEICFAGWTVSITRGRGSIADGSGSVVARFNVNEDGHVTLTEGEHKFADMALIAVRSYVRYGAPQII